MDIRLATDLLRALTREITSRDWEVQGRPSAAVTLRAKNIAEKEALQRLLSTGSFEMSLIVGTQAYGREVRRFQPLSFIHGRNDLEIDSVPERLEG
ncbi:MAG TPA: hypothetical protein VE174_14620 [Actinomycetota bacterium]|nr:hypothetical protein [Actinomycetota bacterium]